MIMPTDPSLQNPRQSRVCIGLTHETFNTVIWVLDAENTYFDKVNLSAKNLDKIFSS